MSTPVSTPDNHENSSAFPEAIDELLHELLSRRALSVLASTPGEGRVHRPWPLGPWAGGESRACRATYKIIVIRETGLAAGYGHAPGAWLPRLLCPAGFCSSTGSSSASTSFSHPGGPSCRTSPGMKTGAASWLAREGVSPLAGRRLFCFGFFLFCLLTSENIPVVGDRVCPAFLSARSYFLFSRDPPTAAPGSPR